MLYRKATRNNKPCFPLMVPKSLEKLILEEAHDSIVSGHLGIARTFDRMKDRYFFPAMIEKVAR